MSVDSWGNDAWFIVSPALNHPDYLNPANTEKFPEFRMSYEFATFLAKWDQGDFGPSDFHTRNFILAQRKSCYPEPLMNRFGVFTTKGEQVLSRAKLYLSGLRRHYEALGQSAADVPQWYEVQRMDQILLLGAVETKHLVYLKTIYAEMFPSSSVMTQFGAKMPTDVEFQYREWNGKLYMMTQALRDYSQRRKDFELMVRFGFIGLDTLPKPMDTHGRGRAPVGGYLTDAGKKFFEDFQVRNDPQIKRTAEIARMMRNEN